MANLLQGEKNAPELPLPYLSVEKFVMDRGYSNIMAGLVWAFDTHRLQMHHDKRRKEIDQRTKGGGSKGSSQGPPKI